MIDKLIEEKVVAFMGRQVIFQKRTLFNRVIVGDVVIALNFNIEDDNQLELIARVLYSIEKDCKIINKDKIVLNEKEYEEYCDFKKVIKILNKYKNL